MLKQFIRPVAFSVLFSIFSSCSEQPKRVYNTDYTKLPDIAEYQALPSKDSMVICHLDEALSQDIRFDLKLSDIAHELEFIQLDNDAEYLVSDKATEYISENYIAILNSIDADREGLMLFNRHTGEFQNYVGRIGQGPGEYRNIYDIEFDEANNRIYILPWTAKSVLVYDLKGVFLQDIPLPSFPKKGQIFVDTDKQLLSVVSMQWADSSDPVFWVQDFQGNIQHEIHAHSLKYEVPDFSNEILSTKLPSITGPNFSFASFTSEPDTLFHYRDGQLVPQFAMNFGEKHRWCILYEFPSNYLVHFFDPILYGDYHEKRFKIPFIKDDELQHKFLYIDKKTHQGGFSRIVVDQLASIEIKEPRFKNGCFVANLYPEDLDDHLDDVLKSTHLSEEEKRRYQQICEETSDNDNNIILIATLK